MGQPLLYDESKFVKIDNLVVVLNTLDDSDFVFFEADLIS